MNLMCAGSDLAEGDVSAGVGERQVMKIEYCALNDFFETYDAAD